MISNVVYNSSVCSRGRYPKGESHNAEGLYLTQKPKEVELRPFFLECCSVRVKPDRVIALEPTYKYVDRYLVYGYCNKCNKPIYKLFEFDLIKGYTVINRDKPKRIKHIAEWIDKLEKQASNALLPGAKIKTGNKSAMAFIFGKSKETPLGIVHSGYDFNGTKRKEFIS